MNNKIKCPNCGFELDVDEVLEHQAEERIRKQFEEKGKLKEQEIRKQIEEENRKSIAEAVTKAKEENASLLKQLREENERRAKENLELKKRESELENQMQQKRIEMEESIRRTEREKNELTFKGYEKRLEDQKKLIDELKRKSEHTPAQFHGEIQEIVLEDLLKKLYPHDKINEVPKGVKGADVTQVIINEMQQVCGVIIYESKRTKSFSDGWIEKLKEDQRTIKADLAVIVTECMPKGLDKFSKLDEVWVCLFNEVTSVSFVLREMLVKFHGLTTSQENKFDKMGLLYSYLTGHEFKQQVEAIVEGFTEQKSELEYEKRAMQKIWKEREKQIEKVINNTMAMYGSIKGIAGASLPPIKNLELPPAD